MSKIKKSLVNISNKLPSTMLTVSLLALSSFSGAANAETRFNINPDKEVDTSELPESVTNTDTIRLPDELVGSLCNGRTHKYKHSDEKTYIVATKGYLKFMAKRQQWKALEKVITTCITDMSGLFAGARSFNADISHWDTSNVTDMSQMFYKAQSFNADISHWDTSNVTDMSKMFYKAQSFNADISHWDTSEVTSMKEMFSFAISFDGNIDKWNTSMVTDMSYMFHYAIKFDSNISKWDVSNVTNMNGMFAKARSFNQDLSGWEVSQVTNMNRMFAEAKSFDQDLSGWEISDETSVDDIFKDATNLRDDYKPVLPKLPKELTDEQFDLLLNMSRIFTKEEIKLWINEIEWSDDK